jgi:repeat protein
MRKQSKHKKRILQALCLVMALCGMSAYAMNVTGSNEVANILRSSSSVETLTINPNGGSATHIDGTTITSSTSKSLGSLIGIGETKSFSTGKQTIDIKGTYHFEVQGGKGGSATITGIGTAQGGDGVTIKSNSVSISKGKELTFHAGATSKDVTKPKIAAFNDVSGANQFGGTGTDVYKNGGSEYGVRDFYQAVYGDGGSCSYVKFSGHSIYAAGGGAGTVYHYEYAGLPNTWKGHGTLKGKSAPLSTADKTTEANSIDFDLKYTNTYGGSFTGGSGLWTSGIGKGAGEGYKNGVYGAVGSNAVAGGSCGQSHVQGFTVTYTKNTTANSYVKMTCDSKIFTISDPTRTGYTFDGWTVVGDGITQTDNGTSTTFTKNQAGNMTITANWTPIPYKQIVKVRYQNADGTWGEYSDVINANYLYGSTVAWTRAADATYKATSISYTVTQVNTKYISVYRSTYIVTLYKGTGIDSVTGAGTYFYGQTATINATLTVGYKWINWTGTTTYSNISNSFTVDGDKTFTANAEPITYTVRFNGNGNWNTSQGSYTQQFTYDLPATLTPNKFTRPDNTTYNSVNYIKGYEFIGWGTSATQTTATYTNGQSVSNLKNTDGAVLDLYAIWKKPVTLTFNFNGGKFNDSTANQVLNYTMYNSELSHTFDIKTYYGGFKNNRISANKGINNKLTKTDTNGIQYRFLGYSLNKNATVPDTQFDVYSLSRTENYTIRDNTTLYAVWEPVLQMTVQLSAPQHSGVMQLTSDVPVTTTLGNFKIPSGTRSTDIPSSATASVNTATIGTNVTNKDLVTYTVSAKGASNIKFSTAADSRILDIYTHGNNNTWFDKLNTTDKFEYTIDNFSNTTSSFTIPQYIGTKKSYKTSNPESATGTSVYAIKFTCTQPSYYYSKYWNSPESTSVYGILFLNPTLPDDSNNGDIVLPPSAVEDGAYEFETILN